MPDIAYINGQILPLEQATVSVNDRGFMFADGVYEAMRTYGGTPYALYRHLKRLERSLSELRIPRPACYDMLESILLECQQRAGYEESLIYIQITRGVSPRSHIMRPALEPTVLVTVRQFHPHSDICYDQGVKTVTVPDERWGRCDIKSLCLLPNTIAKTLAHEMGAYEAILVGKDGIVHEGSSSSVAVVRDGAVYTHPADHHILPGVTRSIVLELCRDHGVEIREEPFSVETLQAADEIFLIGTTYEVMPVVEVDGAAAGGGSPGSVTQRVMTLFRSTTGVLALQS